MATFLDLAQTFIAGPWSSRWFAGNTLDSAVLLLTGALGVAIAFRAGLFNLGGEGQMYLGGLAAAAVLLAPANDAVSAGSPFSAPLVSCGAALAAFVSGGAMGAVSGLLKRYAGANELISSFLLSSALTPVADFCIAGPLRSTTGSLMATERFSHALLLPRFLPPSSFSLSAVFALLLCAAYAFVMNLTAAGYRFRIAGADPAFARYGGIEVSRFWTPAMTLSGGLFGLAGYFAMAGTYGVCHVGFSGGLGWSAIAVSLVAARLTERRYRWEAPALVLAALLFASLEAGSDAVIVLTGVHIETTALIQGIVLLAATAHIVRAHIARPHGIRAHIAHARRRHRG